MRPPSTSEVVRHGKTALAIMMVIALVTSVGCQSTGSTVTLAAPEAGEALAGSPFDPEAPSKYVLHPGDVLLIRYPTDETLDQEVRIRSDGMISLPYAGDVQAAQRSPAELAADLNKKYEGVLKKADVAVIVVKESGRRIYLGGQVRVPGAMILHPNQTLTQALFQAGGLTPEAHTKQIIVMRARPGEGTYVLKADLTRILAGKELDVRLEPLDIVHVPETLITRINQFVEQYINLILPRAVSFPFSTELHTQPIRVLSNQPTIPPVTITR